MRTARIKGLAIPIPIPIIGAMLFIMAHLGLRAKPWVSSQSDRARTGPLLRPCADTPRWPVQIATVSRQRD